jgi:hypothetical protein
MGIGDLNALVDLAIIIAITLVLFIIARGALRGASKGRLGK